MFILLIMTNHLLLSSVQIRMDPKNIRQRIENNYEKIVNVESADPESGWYRCVGCGQKVYYSPMKTLDVVRHEERCPY